MTENLTERVKDAMTPEQISQLVGDAESVLECQAKFGNCNCPPKTWPEPCRHDLDYERAKIESMWLLKRALAAIRQLQEAQKDAERWRWARNKLEVRKQEMMAGPPKPCLSVRLGHSLVNDSHVWYSTNPERDEKRRLEMESAIDAAIQTKEQG